MGKYSDVGYKNYDFEAKRKSRSLFAAITVGAIAFLILGAWLYRPDVFGLFANTDDTEENIPIFGNQVGGPGGVNYQGGEILAAAEGGGNKTEEGNTQSETFSSLVINSTTTTSSVQPQSTLLYQTSTSPTLVSGPGIRLTPELETLIISATLGRRVNLENEINGELRARRISHKGDVTAASNRITLAGRTDGAVLTSFSVDVNESALQLANFSGTLPVTSGGTGSNTQFTQGSIVFAGASGIYTEDNANFFWDDNNNRLGIGDNTPASALTVGAGDVFQVSSSGDIVKIKNLTYSWPTTHETNGVLINDGSGILNWGTLGGGSITPNSLDFTEFQAQLDVDTNTDILTDGTEVLSFTNTGTGSSFLVNDEAGDATPFIITAGGNVGVGEATPASLFSVGSGDLFQVNSSGNVVSIRGVTYSWPNAQGDANRVLTNDGSGNLTWSVSRPQWYAESSTAPTVAPIATGLGSIALGDNAQALGAGMFVYGDYAGNGATDASYATFLGYGAGQDATDVIGSNFLGIYAGSYAANASNANFIGYGAGQSATNANATNILGYYAGTNATNASYSNFIGYQTGQSATNARSSVFIGRSTGTNDTVNNTGSVDDYSILLGNYLSTGGFSNSVLIGAGTQSSADANTATNQFKIANRLTNFMIRGVNYQWPTSQGASNTLLINNGSGALTWSTLGGSSITADSLDFTEFQDQLDLDASTNILVTGSQLFSVTNTGTGNSFQVNDQSTDTTPFVIDNAGFVGIGTSAPTTILHVARGNGAYITTEATDTGSSNFAGFTAKRGDVNNGYASYSWATGGSTNWTLQTKAAYNNLFLTDNSGNDIVTFVQGGNVGVGDTTPDALLDFDFTSTSSTASTQYGSYFTVSDTGVITSGTDITYGNRIDFAKTGSTGGTQTTYGQYINTTSTFASGTGTLTSYGLYIDSTSSSAGTSTAYGAYIDTNVAGSANADTVYGLRIMTEANSTSTATGLYVDVGTGTGSEFAATFLNGNVGIGDISPDSPLDIESTNTSGSFLNISAPSSVTLAGTLTGINMDFLNNYTANNQSVNGVSIYYPDVTNTTAGTNVFSGYYVAGGVITQSSGGGTTRFRGVEVSNAFLTGTSGTVSADGVHVTTSSITTAGTQTGLNVAASGVGAGSLYGVNISSITGGAGTENALNIGTGWDNILNTGSIDISGAGAISGVGSILPGTDDTYDLGSSSFRWRDLYLGGETLHLGTSTSDEAVVSYTTSSNLLNFSTDSTSNGDIAFFSDDLYLDKSSGFVGIGTTAPGNLLQVFGSNNPAIQVGGGLSQGTTAGKSSFVWRANNGTVDNTFAAEYTKDTGIDRLTFIAGGATNVLTLENGGDVGIGTTNPGYLLDVNGDVQINNIWEFNQSGIFNWGSGYAYGTITWDTGFAKINAQGSNALKLYSASSGGIDVISSGYVGIGTTAPTASLELYGASQTTAALTDAGARTGILALNATSTAAGNGGTITFGNIQSIAAGSIGFAAIKGLLTNGGANTEGDLAFSTRNSSIDTALTERLRIVGTSGNVGVGISSPGARLEVRNTRTSGANAIGLILSDPVTGAQTGGFGTLLRFSSNTGQAFSEIMGGQGDAAGDGSNNQTQLRFRTQPSAGNIADRMTITSVGYVGIGVTAPITQFSNSTVINTGAVSTSGINWRIDEASKYAASFKNANASGYGVHIEAGASTNGLIVESGRVGIGTTGPSTKLHVSDLSNPLDLRVTAGGSGYTAPALLLESVGAADTRGQGVFMLDTLGGQEWYAGTGYSNTDQYIIARQAVGTHDGSTAQGGFSLLTITNAGQVGIGSTTSANTKLMVYHNGSTGGISDAAMIVRQDGTDPVARFQGSGGGAIMTILSGGNVSIGSTVANTKLEIRDGAPTLRLQETTTGGDKRIELGVTSGGVAWLGANQSAQSLTFQTVGSERMRIDSSGNVGIADTSPDALLDFDLTSTSSTAGTEYGSYFTVSDTGVVTTGTDTTYGNRIDLSKTGSTGGTQNTYGQYINTTSTFASGTGTLNSYGLYINSTSSSAGTSTAYGAYIDTNVSGSANADTVYGLRIATEANGTSTATGLYVDSGTGTGTEYSAVFLNGRVGIGDDTPDGVLDIEGSSANLLELGSSQSSGSIINMTAPSSVTLGSFGYVAGVNMDLLTNYNTNNASIDGILMYLPGASHTSTFGVPKNTAGLTVYASGQTLTINDSIGFANFYGTLVSNPNLVQTSGVANAFGHYVSTGTNTTGGNQYGLYVNSTGVSAGTLTGVNMSNITAGAGTEKAVNIGTGWDYGIYSATTGDSYFAGNIGIGTTGPVGKLDVRGQQTTGAAVFTAINTGTSGTPYGADIEATGSNGSGTNTGLYVRALNGGTNYAIYSAGGTNYFLDSVGIGTTGPNAKLDVQGTSVVTRLLSTNNNYVVQIRGNNATNGGWIGTDSSDDLLFATGSGANEAIRIDSTTSNIGINTSTPTAGRVSIVQNTNPGTTPAALDISLSGVSGGTATSQYGIKVSGGAYNNSTNVYGIHSSMTQQLSSPTYGLYSEASAVYASGYGVYGKGHHGDINGPAVVYGVYGHTTSSGSGSGGTTYAGYFYNQASLGGGAVGVYAVSVNGNPLIVSNGTTERMRVDSSGRVGIGTTNPLAKLVVSNAGAEGVEFIPGNGAGNSVIQVYNRNDSTYDDLYTDALSFIFRRSGTATMTISSAGALRLHDYGAGTLTTDASGNVTASSDERLKNVEGNFTKGLSALQDIQPIAYRWKSSSGLDRENVYYGFSAQNIRESIPEAIDTDPRGFLTLSDRPILATVINATKELNSTVIANRGVADESAQTLAGQMLTLEEGAVDLSESVNEMLQSIEDLQTDVNALKEQIAALEAAGGNSNENGIFQNGLSVIGASLFEGLASFTDAVFFEKTVTFAEDAAGAATLPAGETEIEVSFETPYLYVPVVTVTPRNFLAEGNYRVSEESESGFTISVSQAQAEDIEFSWIAIQKREE